MTRRARQILGLLLFQSAFAVSGSAQTTTGSFLLSDWTANFVDSLPDAGTIFIQPFYGDTSTVYFNDYPLKQPYSITINDEGFILVSDRVSTPDGIVNGMGTVFRMSPVTGDVTLAVGSEEFRALRDLDVHPDGSILVVDREADPFDRGGDTGALFKIDPDTEEVTVFSSIEEYVDPYGVLVDSTGAIYVFDENANPLGWPNDSGAIWKIDPTDGGLVRLVSSDPVLSTPLDGVRVGNTLYVADMTAEIADGIFTGTLLRVDMATGEAENTLWLTPFFGSIVDVEYVPPFFYLLDKDADFEGTGGFPGGIYRISPENWRLQRFASSGLWGEPQSFCYFPTSRVLVSDHDFVDPNGGFIASGDTIRVDVEVQCIVEIPTGFSIRDTLPADVSTYIEGSLETSTGVAGYDDSGEFPLITWTGSLGAYEAATISFGLEITDIEPIMGEIRNVVEIEDDVGGVFIHIATDSVYRGLHDDEVIIADLVSYFSPGYVAALGPDGALHDVFPSADSLINPNGVHVDANGIVYIADLDADPFGDGSYGGGLFRYSPRDRLFELFAADEAWSEPASVTELPNGRLVLLDNSPQEGGSGRGTLYLLNPETAESEDTIMSDDWVWPVAVAVTPFGDMLLTDRDANPNGYEHPHKGAIWRIDPDGNVELDVANWRFVAPAAIAAVSSEEYLIADRNADPYGQGGDRGAIFLRSPGAGVTVFSADPVLQSPMGIAISRSGHVLVADAGSNVIHAISLLNPTEIELFSDVDLIESVSAIATRPTSRFSESMLEWTDLSGGNFVPGDEAFYMLRIRNTGNLADENVIITNDLPELIDIQEGTLTASVGEAEYDPDLHQVRWQGPIPVLDIVRVHYNGDLRDEATMGALVVSDVLITPSETAEVVLADSQYVVSSFLSGDLLILDGRITPPDVDGTGSLLRRNYASGSPDLLVGGDPFLLPSSVAVDPQNHALIVDKAADPYDLGAAPGGVFRYDPRTDVLETVASTRDFVTPTDLAVAPEGDIYVVDRDADPFDLPGNPGAVLHVDPVSGEVTALASDPEWVNPIAIAYDLDGSLIMLDRLSIIGDSGGTGGLFRVDSSTGDVDGLVTGEDWVWPQDVIVAPDGDYIIVDREADPIGYGGEHGTLFKVDRDDLTVSIFCSDQVLVEPSYITRSVDDDFLVVDGGDAEGITFWTVDAETGGVYDFYRMPELEAVVGIYLLEPPSLTTSSWSVVDQNGPPVRPGDLLSYDLTIRNSGLSGAEPLQGTITPSEKGEFDPGSIEVSSGSVEVVGDEIMFEGALSPGDSARVSFEFTIADGLTQGDRIETDAHLDADNGVVLDLRDLQKIPFQYLPNDMILLDRISNPEGLPNVTGALFKWDHAQNQFFTLASQVPFQHLRTMMIDPRDPSVLYVVDADADPKDFGDRHGAILKMASNDGRLLDAFSSPLFRDPTGVFTDLNGDLVLVDYNADPDSVGNSGALFSIDRETGAISTLISHHLFSDPRDGVALADGSFIVVDRGANPFGLDGNVGTIFKVRPGGGVAEVAATGGLLVDPVDIADAGDGSYIIVDETANPAGYDGNTGALFRYTPNGDFLELLVISEQFVAPFSAKVGNSGEIFVVDHFADPNGPEEGKGAIFRYRPSDESVMVYAYGTPLRSSRTLEFFDNPTPVFIISLVARETDAGRVQLDWEAVVSGDVLGFDLYRREVGAGSGHPDADDVLAGDLPPDSRSYTDTACDPGRIYDYWAGLTPEEGAYTLSPAVRVALIKGVPTVFALNRNSPNPFGRRTGIAFDVPPPGSRVMLRIYDLGGRLVRRLIDSRFAPGRYVEPWDGRDDRGHNVAPGVYFCRMNAPSFTETHRLVLIR